MKSLLFVLILTVCVCLIPGPAVAHHSFGATYDVSKEISLKGTIVQISLRSPHSFFYVEAPDDKGEPQRWSVEGASVAQFAQQGVTRDAFKVGDTVEVICNPARSTTSYRGRLVKITRESDGKSWGNRAGETVN
jgi:hypothetical protein